MPSNFIIALASRLLSGVASMILEMEWLRQRLVVEFIFLDMPHWVVIYYIFFFYNKILHVISWIHLVDYLHNQND